MNQSPLSQMPFMPRRILACIAAIGITAGATAQTTTSTINFDTPGNWIQGALAFGSYSNHGYAESAWSFTSTNTIRNGNGAQDGFPGALGTYSWRLRDGTGSQFLATYTEAMTVSAFGFAVRRWDGSPDPSYTVEYSVNGGLDFTDTDLIINNEFLESSSNWKTLSFTLPEPVAVAANQFLVRVTRVTGERIMIDDFQWTFVPSADETAPSIVSLSPSNGLTAALTNTALTIQYNEPVIAGTSGALTVRKTSDNSVVETITLPSEQVSTNGPNGIVRLSSLLDTSTSYYVDVDAGFFTDAANNPAPAVSGATEWTFTTEAPDTTGPVPTAFVPATGATNVRIEAAEIKITFDEPITYNEEAAPIEVRTVEGDVLIEELDALSSSADVTSANELTILILDPLVLDYETEYYISVPAGTVEDSLGNDNLAFGAPASSKPWTFTTLLEPTPPSVVINKYANTASGGATDLIELLVIGNETPGSTLDMRGMIVKDFSSSMSGDGGGKFEFADNPLWQSVPVGTLIVLDGGTTSSDTDAADFKIAAGLRDTALFVSSTANSFDIATTEMIMIKAAGSDAAGVTGGIHALAAGTAGTLFNDFLGPKLIATDTTGTALAVIANNSNSELADYSGTDATGAVTASTLKFGAANNTTNAAYITQLRGILPGDGDGAVTLANVSEGSHLTGSPVFGSGLSEQSAALTLNATLPGASISTVSIQVPEEFGIPSIATLSGPGAGSAEATITGQSVSITGAAATVDDALVVTITGLQAPVPPEEDYGNYLFSISTAASGGTLSPIGRSPAALVAIPISKLRATNSNGVPLAFGEQVAVDGVITAVNFNTSTTLAAIQDTTAGLALFNNDTSPSPFARGDRHVVYGTVVQFNGLTQLNFSGFVNLGTTTEPEPIVLTVPELLAAAEQYEGSLVTLENLS